MVETLAVTGRLVWVQELKQGHLLRRNAWSGIGGGEQMMSYGSRRARSIPRRTSQGATWGNREVLLPGDVENSFAKLQKLFTPS